MKKTHAIEFCIIVIMISVTIFVVPCLGTSWGVTAGQTADYNLNQIEIDYSFPPTIYNATSIIFDNDSLIESSNILLNVTNVDENNIDYQLSSGNYTEAYSISNNSISAQIDFMVMLPLRIANKEISLSNIKRGFTGIDQLLIPSDSTTWQYFNSYADPVKLIATEEIFSSLADVDIQAKYYMNETKDISIFDWFVNGTYFDEAENIDFTIYYNLKVAYEVSSGLLLGKRVYLELLGDNPDDEFYLIYKSELERSDYNLGVFLLPSDDSFDIDELLSSLFPGFKWYILLIVFCPLIIIPRIIAKRKR